MQRCGTDRIFTSSLDLDAEVSYTSSLRAEDVPLSPNGTVVGCVDGADTTQTIGSTTICIVGKPFHTLPLDSPPLCKGQQHVLRGGSVS